MGLDFKKYDVVSAKEAKINSFFSDKTEEPILSLASYIKEKKDMIMVKTLMSILFKVRNKLKYMPDEKKKEEDKIKQIENIIKKIYLSKDIDDIEKIILKYGNELKKILKEFFYKQKLNYIQERLSIKSIIDHGEQHEISKLNPYMLCQLFDICANPLTEEENIINEIINYRHHHGDLRFRPERQYGGQNRGSHPSVRPLGQKDHHGHGQNLFHACRSLRGADLI